MRHPLVIAVVAACLGLAACEEPLGPGLAIEKQRVDVSYAQGSVTIRARYTVRNAGKGPLETLRVSLNTVNPGAIDHMKIVLDGAPVQWAVAREEAGNSLVITLAPPWQRKQRHEIALEYEIPSGGVSRAAPSFQLLPGSWSPSLAPPKALFAKAGGAPKRWDFNVIVPEGYRVHATGRARGTRKSAGGMAHRFEQRPQDPLTYTIAGKYHETVVSSEGFRIIFWTFADIKRDDAERVGRRLAAALKSYRDWFGPLENDARSVWVVDGSGVRYILGAPGISLPGLAPQAIVDPGMFSYDPEAFSPCVADEQLAGMWTSWLARPDAAAAPIAAQLARHAANAVPGGCDYRIFGARERGDAIRSMLRGFDAAGRNATTQPERLQESYRREREGYRMRLLLFALEDAGGRDALHRATRRMLQALRGGTWGRNELRSALEAETGKDLGEFFRVWARPDEIPAAFRAAYPQ